MSLALASRRAAISPAWVKNPLWRTARAVPSLDLPFADTKSLADAVTGQSLVTFTRASSGTSVGSDGVLRTAAVNEPRFDHNPTTGESLGLLVEEQRTNLLLRSEEFDNASWTKQSSVSVSANTDIAPNGTQTADTVTADQTLGVFQSVTSVVGLNYANSVYIKAGTATSMMLRDDTGAGRHIVFNPSTGAITSTAGTLVSSGSQAVGNGWYRYWIVYAADATTVRGIIRPNSSGSAQTFFVWGAQIEAGAFPTSYIPTTTAAATRSADVASITGTAFSSWYRQDEGTVFADVISAPVSNVAQLAYDISEGVGNERLFQRRNASGFVGAAVVDNGVTQGDIGSVAISASARYRSGFAYKLNDLEIVVNGGGSVTDTSATLPTLDRIHIGQNYASGQSCNGTIRRLVFFPQRLPNSTLQAITQ